MKLLLISVKSDSALGGIAVWTDRFLSRCGELDIDCSLVNTELIGSRVKTGKRSVLGELVRTRRIFRELKRLLKKETFDAAYLNTSCGNFGLFRDCRIAEKICAKKIPLVTQYHCEIPYWVRKRSSRRCLGKLAGSSQKNLVLCQNSKDFLSAQYGLDSIKVPNFVEETMVRSDLKPITPEIRQAVFVGRVSQAKGAAELYEVAKQLPDIRFTLIGEVGSPVQQWEKPQNVQLLGHVPHERIPEHLDQADVFLFPSHTEGCSMALMEAMARGVPAIATDTGANADMLSGGCGVIVEKHDIAAMVAAIRSLEDPKRRVEISHQAVQKVSENYTEMNVDKIISIMEQLQNQ